jgi:isocitrate dehydrogenase kinase/phosphatase
MSALEQLWAVYRQWKELTEREGRAIEDGNWSMVQQRQEAKRALQTDIVHLTEQVYGDLRSPTEHEKFDGQLRTIVNELILLETGNNLTLQAALATAKEQKRSFEATSTRLRKVHSSYVPQREPVWQNLS